MPARNKFGRFDFSHPEHADFVAQCFGGLEHMKEAYPNIYRQYRNSVNLAANSPAVNTAPPGFVDRVHLHCLFYDKRQGNYSSLGNTVLTKKASAIHMVLEILRGKDRLARTFCTRQSTQSADLKCATAPVSSSGSPEEICATAVAFWNEAESDLLHGGYGTDNLIGTGGECVNTTLCNNPRKTIAQVPESIIVNYGRQAWRTEVYDYIYPESRDPKGDQRVMLEMDGTVELKPSCSFVKYLNHDISLFSVERGVIPYGGGAPVITPNAKGFSWAFDKAWQDVIPESVKFGDALYQFDLRLTFQCKDSAGKLLEQFIEVTSVNDDMNDANTVTIKPLKLLWGCLAKNAKVRMADGLEKEIQHIRIGDRVATPKGASVVNNIWTGVENFMHLIIGDRGEELLATAGHPVLTEAGFIRVRDCDAATKFVMADGRIAREKDHYVVPYADTVYSLDLENGEAFLCSGFVSGTYDAQNRISPKMADAAPLSSEQTAELARLEEETREGRIFASEAGSLPELPIGLAKK